LDRIGCAPRKVKGERRREKGERGGRPEEKPRKYAELSRGEFSKKREAGLGAMRCPADCYYIPGVLKFGGGRYFKSHVL